MFVGLIKFLKPQKPESAPFEKTFEEQVPIHVEPLAPVAQPPLTPLKEHMLEVFTTTPLWMRIKTEARSFEGFIPQESTWSWRGDGEFQIRLGHTRQVALHFDGDEIPLRENQKRVQLPYED